MARLNRTNKAKQNKSLKGLDQPNILSGGKSDEILEGGISEDTINGGNGNDVLIGGEGADDFELSEGNDVVQDFNNVEGDSIILPDDIETESIKIDQDKKNVIISWKNKKGDEFRTKVKGKLHEIIPSIEIPKLDQQLDKLNIGNNPEKTVLKTGVITKYNKTIYLPATNAADLEIRKATGKLVKGQDYSLDDTKTAITFTDKFINETNTQLKIKATFDWNNQGKNNGNSERGDVGTGTLQWLQDQGLLLWLRDVEQLGEGSEFETKQAFRGYLGKGLTAVEEVIKRSQGNTSFYEMFAYAARLDVDLSGLMPDLNSVSDMYGMHKFNARYDNGDGDLDWDTNNVERMRQTFWNAFNFNQDISGWDTGSVVDDIEGGKNGGMMRMFKNTPKFDQNLSGWEADQLNKALQTDFNTTFSGTKENQDIDYPKTQFPSFGGGAEDGSGTSTHHTVLRTRNLRGPLKKRYLNKETGKFELILPIANNAAEEMDIYVENNNGLQLSIEYDSATRKLTIPQSGANQYLIRFGKDSESKSIPWDNSEGASDSTSAGTINKLRWLEDVIQFGDGTDDDSKGDITSGTAAFTGYGGNIISDLNNLDMGSITSTDRMFYDARKFNQNLPQNFIGSNITSMEIMFENAYRFNDGAEAGQKSENSYINGWGTENVNKMKQMFSYAVSFNQDVGDWTTSEVVDDLKGRNGGGMRNMFMGTPFFKEDLSGWSVDGLSAERNTNFNTNLRGAPQGTWPNFEGAVTEKIPYEGITTDSNTKVSGNADLRAAAFGNNLFMAGGANGTILTSDNGVDWESQSSINGGAPVQGLVYGNGGFMAATGSKESNGNGGSLAFMSIDGDKWVPETVEGLAELNYLDVAFGNEKFIAPSKEGQVAIIGKGSGSTDVKPVSTKELRAASYGDDLFIVAGVQGEVYSSTDGTTWADISSDKFNFQKLLDQQQSGKNAIDKIFDGTKGDLNNLSINFNAATFGEGKHIIAGSGGAIFYSTNGGKGWKFAAANPFTTKENINSLDYADGMFIAGGTNGKTALSVDGINWYEEDIAFPEVADGQKGNYNVNALANGNGVVVGVSSVATVANIDIGSSNSSAKIFKQSKSYSDFEWGIQESQPGGDLRSAAFGDGKFVAGGGNGTLLLSKDGSTWNELEKIDGVIQGLAYGKGGFFAATGNKNGSGSGAIYKSDNNGENWVESEAQNLNYLDLATDGKEEGSYAAVSQDGSIVVNDVEIESKNTNELRAVSYGDEKFIAAGKTGTILHIAKSNKGYEVQEFNSAPLKVSNLNGITFGSGVWVAGGSLGSLFTSKDGKSWERVKVNPYLAEENITSLAYGDGLFVAGGTNGKTAVSVDGTNWYEEDIAFPKVADGQKGNYNVNALAFGDGQFIGVSSNSKIASASPNISKPTSITNLLGTAGSDSLQGVEGNNLIKGYAGDDVLSGNSGNDTLEGGEGQDTFGLASSNKNEVDIVLDFNLDEDKLSASNPEEYSPSRDENGDAMLEHTEGAKTILEGVDTNINDLLALFGLESVEQNDIDKNFENEAEFNAIAVPTFVITEKEGGSEFDTIITPALLADQLGLKSEVLREKTLSIKGSTASEAIYGGNVSDTIKGGGGKDSLDGGAGDDVLEGGDGADTYYLSRSGNQGDVILGYNEDDGDKIILPGTSTFIEVEGNLNASPKYVKYEGNEEAYKNKGAWELSYKIGNNESNKTTVVTTTDWSDPNPPQPPAPQPDTPTNNGDDGGSGGGNGGSGDGEGGIDNAPGAPEPSPTPEQPSEPEDGTIDGQPIVPTPEPGPTPETEEDPQLRQRSVIKDPKNKDFDNAFIGKDKKKDELNGSNKADVLKGKGKSDIVKGSKGNDYLYGNKGGDILKGGKGADVLQGGSGKDELSGGGGKDMIYGGNSDDEISGNGGKDIFVLSRGKDIITDFKVGTDNIGLVYALDLKLKQKGDDLLIKASDNVVHTKLLNVTRDEFLGDFSESNSYLQLPIVEVNVL